MWFQSMKYVISRKLLLNINQFGQELNQELQCTLKKYEEKKMERKSRVSDLLHDLTSSDHLKDETFLATLHDQAKKLNEVNE